MMLFPESDSYGEERDMSFILPNAMLYLQWPWTEPLEHRRYKLWRWKHKEKDRYLWALCVPLIYSLS